MYVKQINNFFFSIGANGQKEKNIHIHEIEIYNIKINRIKIHEIEIKRIYQ